MTTTATAVTFEQLLDVVLPPSVVPAGEGCLRLVAQPVGVALPTEEVAWFVRMPGWVRLRRYGWKESPESLAQFLGAHAEQWVGVAPVAVSSGGVPRGPVASVWATLPIATEPAPQLPQLMRPNPTAAARVRALAEAVTPAPSVVVDEGSRLALGWLLTEVVSLPEAEAVSAELLSRVRGGPVWPAEPVSELLVSVPGLRNQRLHPTPEVRVSVWEPSRTYPLAQLATAP